MKRETNKYEVTRELTYPENIVDVLNNIRLPFQEAIPVPITWEQNKGIKYVVSHLNKREQEIIRLIFEENMTLQQTGDQFGVTRERIRQQLKGALDKMRSVYLWDYLVHGYVEDAANKDSASGEIQKPKIDVRQDISTLGLSSRLENCLHRVGVDTIAQFLDFKETYLLNGCGKKSTEELIDAQRSLRDNFTIPVFALVDRIKESNLSARDKDIIIEKLFLNFDDKQLQSLGEEQ